MNEEYGVKGPLIRLVQREQQKFSNDRFVQTPNHLNFDLDFSDTGLVSRKTLYTYAETVFRVSEFEYDDLGRLTRTVDFDGTGVKIGSSELVYSEGRCAWTDRDGAEIKTGQGVEEYDGERLICISTFDSPGTPRTKKTFEYSNSRLVKSDSRYYLPTGALNERWLTDYDSEGRVAKTYGLNPDGSPLGDGKYSYEYDERGRRAKVWTYNEFDDGTTPSSVSLYEYVDDELGNWIEQRKCHIWRNDSYESRTITTRKLTYRS
jgi:hypothetical protein